MPARHKPRTAVLRNLAAVLLVERLELWWRRERFDRRLNLLGELKFAKDHG